MLDKQSEVRVSRKTSYYLKVGNQPELRRVMARQPRGGARPAGTAGSRTKRGAGGEAWSSCLYVQLAHLVVGRQFGGINYPPISGRGGFVRATPGCYFGGFPAPGGTGSNGPAIHSVCVPPQQSQIFPVWHPNPSFNNRFPLVNFTTNYVWLVNIIKQPSFSQKERVG
jgi:hypothetical protein